MNLKKKLWRLAMGCAVLLLFALSTPRTSWTHVEGYGMTHSAGWDWIALLSGIVAIVALSLGRWSRPSVPGAATGVAVAAVAFAVSAAASAGHWYSLATGALNLEWEWTTYPAPLVLPFAVVAIAGAVCSLVLVGTWLRPEDLEQ
jgi:hypothetical protein